MVSNTDKKDLKVISAGFTGTRDGMTDKQATALSSILQKFDPDWFHHGDCLGADLEAHSMAKGLGISVHVHPPSNDTHRAYCDGDREAKPFTYLTRNRHIVNKSDILIAAPKGPEELKSGTWSTIRYARKQGKPIIIIDSNGKIDDERI